MSKQKPQLTTFTLPAMEGDSSSSSNLVKKYLFHWPLFVLGLIVFFVAAFFYLQVTKPTYPILATIEFKGPTSSEGTVINKNGANQQLDPISTPVIVENEIEVMQSKKIMYKVVNDLQLWVDYTLKDGTDEDLYKKTPVKFQYVKSQGTLDAAGVKINIIVKDRKSFTLVDDDAGNKDYAYGSTVKSDIGTWKLNATPELNNYIGANLEILVQDPDQVTDAYQTTIKVELENKDAPFVNLSTADQVPERGKDILNEVMGQYKQDAMNDKNTDAQKAINFINVRLDSLLKNLNIDERQIQNYKSGQSMTDIASQSQGFRDIRQANIKALNDAEIQLKILNGIESAIENGSNTSTRLPPTSAYLNDPSLMTLYDKLTDLQLKKTDLLATVPETNSMVRNIDEQITSLKAAFLDKVKALKASQLAIKAQMTTFDSGIQAGLKKIPEQDRVYTSMKRNQESKENIYKFLLEQREALSLRYASTVSDAEIVDDAHASKAKWPKPIIVYALALILGIGAPIGLLYARETLNERISNRKQIENAVKVPILGELTYQEDATPIVVTQGRGKFAIGEQFRVLRTNLSHLHGTTESGRVTLFTSSIGSEGKSFVTSNLAVTLAYASRKTIILEMDLRKPKISGVFGLSPEHPGISDYLSETATDLKKLIQPSGIPGLDILGCGPILPNPSELLEKERLDLLVSTLKETYDDVLIDSPPIHLVTDAYIISRVAGATIYMIRQGHTLKDELEFINEVDSAERFPKFTLVFNGIKRDIANYGYGYSNSYYSSYNTYNVKEKETIGTRIRAFLRRF